MIYNLTWGRGGLGGAVTSTVGRGGIGGGGARSTVSIPEINKNRIRFGSL